MLRLPLFSPVRQLKFIQPLFGWLISGTGGEVQTGETLIEMENDDLRSDLAQLLIEIKASIQREIRYLNRGEVAAAEVERANRTSLKQREQELTRMVEALTVRAPVAGRVLTRQLDQLVGQELAPGSELLRISSTDQPELVALIPQSEADSLRGRAGEKVAGWSWGHTAWMRGTIESIEPRATQISPHPALTAEAGGALPVVARDPRDMSTTANSNSHWLLLDPQLEVTIRLDASSEPLLLGETGVVRLPVRGGTLAEYVIHQVESWTSARATMMHGL